MLLCRSHKGNGTVALIFVTVGNANQGFRRLLGAVEALAGEGVFGDDVVMIQAGNNPIPESGRCRYQTFLSNEEFIKAIREATLIICHAGAGSLLHILREGKRPVVMPRQKRYGEHVDDHQMELTRALATEGRVIPAFEPGELAVAIEAARRRNVQPVPAAPSQMLRLVAEIIVSLDGKERK